MLNSKAKRLTKEQRAFLEPKNANHRQYEALRAYFVEGLSSNQVAERFGYTPGSFRVLCSEFRQNLDRPFFISSEMGPKKSPKKDDAREQVIAMRKQNLSVYDIAQLLAEQGKSLSIPSISAILQQEGFARLPRRKDEERPNRLQPEAAASADARLLNLEPRQIHTHFGGIFLFLPYLAQIPFDQMLKQAHFPGTKTHRPLSRGTGLRLEADHLCQLESLKPTGGPVHHSQTPLAEHAPGIVRPAAFGLAKD
jgi:transposase